MEGGRERSNKGKMCREAEQQGGCLRHAGRGGGAASRQPAYPPVITSPRGTGEVTACSPTDRWQQRSDDAPGSPTPRAPSTHLDLGPSAVYLGDALDHQVRHGGVGLRQVLRQVHAEGGHLAGQPLVSTLDGQGLEALLVAAQPALQGRRRHEAGRRGR